jgi:hypothetical protein
MLAFYRDDLCRLEQAPPEPGRPLSRKRVLVSPAWLTRVTWDDAKTFFCIATAVDDWGVSV